MGSMKDTEIRENWKCAGILTGRAYADELQKLALIHLIDQEIEARAGGDEAKQASMVEKAIPFLKKLKPFGVAAGMAAVSGATGAAVGKGLGKREEHGRAEEALSEAAPQIFRAGFVQGARQGFMQGARQGYLRSTGTEGGKK